MKIIFDNSESAAPVAPLLLATEEQEEEFSEAMEEAKEKAEEEEKPSGRGFAW